jgi:hypothetical protein
MENAIQSGILRGRPFGGLAVMLKNNIAKNVECLAAVERYMVLKIGKLTLVNVYAPVNSKNYDRHSVILEMLS